jgi:RNase P subunit RPR2
MIDFTTTRLRPSKCTNCHKLIDSASTTSNAVPKPRDITLCLYCGHIMVYTAKLKLRNPTDDEIIAIAGNPTLLKYQEAIAYARRLKDKKS